MASQWLSWHCSGPEVAPVGTTSESRDPENGTEPAHSALQQQALSSHGAGRLGRLPGLKERSGDVLSGILCEKFSFCMEL